MTCMDDDARVLSLQPPRVAGKVYGAVARLGVHRLKVLDRAPIGDRPCDRNALRGGARSRVMSLARAGATRVTGKRRTTQMTTGVLSDIDGSGSVSHDS